MDARMLTSTSLTYSYVHVNAEDFFSFSDYIFMSVMNLFFLLNTAFLEIMDQS